MSGAEGLWFLAGGSCYAAGASVALHEAMGRRSLAGLLRSLLFAGAVMIALAIAVRWLRVGHGPFLDMYEILMSNLFSLGLIYALAHWRFPGVRAGAPLALTVLVLLTLWAATVPAGTAPLPPTYETPWLWAHVIAGKLFLGTALVSASLAVLGLLPRRWRASTLTPTGAATENRDALAWQWLLVAFVFHSFMLLAGAVWAQDAWGRYWDWDPLETWAFATWLLMAGALHARAAFTLDPRVGRCLILATFVVAFLTFFGVPFVSLAPHQGAV
jgi:ABC-type transport system involved in cytochrome c biogenesis permease subunit